MTFLDKTILGKPIYRGVVEWLILVIIGVLGEVFSWGRIPFRPYSVIIGCIIIAGAFALHIYCHRIHHQAHKQSSDINNIVNTGIFGKIRHPMYLSLILVDIGFAIAWGIYWIFLPVCLFIISNAIVAIREEKFLVRELGSQYKEYMQQVPWRFIPRVF
jgi:protein-S-isoprenylcysteine O-methyltransferase Ste14